MQQCQVRVFPQIFVPSFDPNEWCLKNGLRSGGLNPGPLGHESSALTTRPRLLAKVLSVSMLDGDRKNDRSMTLEKKDFNFF
jgi:hypothetical protein